MQHNASIITCPIPPNSSWTSTRIMTPPPTSSSLISSTGSSSSLAMTLVLSNDNTIRTRIQKFIGTRKQNSEAAAITKQAKDSDASSSDTYIKETQGTSSSMSGDDDERSSQLSGQDHAGRDVEPRSYRDVVVNE